MFIVVEMVEPGHTFPRLCHRCLRDENSFSIKENLERLSSEGAGGRRSDEWGERMNRLFAIDFRSMLGYINFLKVAK
jgi:hypothetical protein